MRAHDHVDPDGDKRARASLLFGVVSAAFGAGVVVISASLQIVLSYYFCKQEVGRDLEHPRSATANLELDLTPVVECKTAHGTMAFPIAGSVTSLGAAILLLLVLLISLVVYWVRR